MKQWTSAMILTVLLASAAFGAAKGPEITVIDSKVSMDAQNMPLGRLLQLLDRATGLKSTVPAELSNRNLSVKFSGLNYDEAVRKIFEGQPIDYVVIGGQGVMVTALSQQGGPGPDSGSAPALNQLPPQVEQQTFIEENPGGQPQPPPFIPPQAGGFPGAQPPGAVVNSPFNQQQQQPAMIQTPFGPIPNPRANQPMPGAAPNQQNPFGQVNPFGNPPPAGQNNQNNNILGNTSPPLFNQNPTPAK